MTFLAGSWMTTSIGGRCDEPVHDPRIRAFAGYVPWAGYSFLPAYCNGQAGAAFVNRPYLAMSGTADTTAPLTQMKQALNLFTNTRYMVELQDGQHELRPEDADELFTWLVTYLDTYLDVQSDPGAFGRLAKMNSVSGPGRVDTVTVDVHIPFPNAGSELTVQELYNPVLNHYYVTDDAFEANALTTSPYMSWKATGNGFKAWPSAYITGGNPWVLSPVCRFDLAGRPGAGILLHQRGPERLRHAQVEPRLELLRHGILGGTRRREPALPRRLHRSEPRLQQRRRPLRLEPSLQHERLDHARHGARRVDVRSDGDVLAALSASR